MNTSRRKEPKYIQELEQRLEQDPLLDLMDEVIEMAPGNNYDGCFTTRGHNEFKKAKEILEARILELAESLTYWHNKGTMGDLPCSGWDSNCGTCPVLANIERKEKGSE